MHQRRSARGAVVVVPPSKSATRSRRKRSPESGQFLRHLAQFDITLLIGRAQNAANLSYPHSERIYVTGLSNGGALTQVLACDAADLFAAAAPVAFPGAFDPLTDCSPSRPIPIVAFQGVTDLLVPYSGGNLLGSLAQPVVESAQATFDFWRDENGCSGTSPNVVEDIGLSNSCELYDQCDGGVVVELCSVTGTAGAPLNGLLYFNNNGLNVAQRAWNVMSAHTLSGSPTGPSVSILTLPGAAILTTMMAGLGGTLAMRRRNRD